MSRTRAWLGSRMMRFVSAKDAGGNAPEARGHLDRPVDDRLGRGHLVDQAVGDGLGRRARQAAVDQRLQPVRGHRQAEDFEGHARERHPHRQLGSPMRPAPSAMIR